jgi:transcriptional regulator with XRE-family HTH domain
VAARGSGSSATPHDARRRELGDRIRRLRREAGLTQVALAAGLGLRQSSVSEWETGRTAPEAGSLARLADILGLDEATRAELIDQVAELQLEISTWRNLHRRGHLANQARYARMESEATTIRILQMAVVPGLLQTPGYALAMMAHYDPALEGLDDLVEGRMRRQAILSDPEKRFQFLVGESVLHSRRYPASVMREQLDRLLLLAAMQRVEVGVLPLAYQHLAITSFIALDEALVLVELDTSEVMVRDAREIARYLDVFDRLRSVAVTGGALADLVRPIGEALGIE